MTGIGSMTQDYTMIQGNTRAHHRNRSNKTGSWERKSQYTYIFEIYIQISLIQNWLLKLLELVFYAKDNGQGEKRSEDNILGNTVTQRMGNE